MSSDSSSLDMRPGTSAPEEPVIQEPAPSGRPIAPPRLAAGDKTQVVAPAAAGAIGLASIETLAEDAGWLENLFSGMPSWLASLMVHLGFVLIMALCTFPLGQKQPTSLSTVPSDEEVVELNEEVMDIDIEPLDEALDENTELDVAVELETQVEVDSLDAAPLADLTDTSLAMVDFSADIGLTEVMTGTSEGMSGTGLTGRSAAGRRAMARKKGGSRESEKAVEESLKWLARHQLPNGAWSFDHRFGECNGQCSGHGDKPELYAGATGLALLPFLGSGNTHRDGKYKEVVNRGALALVKLLKITPEGATVVDKDKHYMYCHGIASMALSEAFAMTGDESFREPAQAMLAYTCNAQDPKGGGWRYKPRQPGDTSVMGWHVGALKSGYMASLEVPSIVIQRASYYLDSAAVDGGIGYCYVPEKPKYGPATSAIGLLCRMYIGIDQQDATLKKGVEKLVATGPKRHNAYFNYYAAQVIYQFTSGEGDLWQRWNEKMREQLISTQETKGHASGSWTPENGNRHHAYGGRLYTTAMSAMTLEVYYRLMPIYQKKATEGFEE